MSTDADPGSLSPDDLPMDPEEFAESLIDEVDAYIEAHGLGDARFEEDLTEDQMREGLYTRIFNEIKAIDHPRRMLGEAEDPQVFIHLLKQIEDEAKHARMLSQRLWNLGGDPQEVFERADESTREFWTIFDERDIVGTAAVLQTGAEHMAQYRHPKELQFYDDETAEIYERVIVPEEQFHAKIGKNVFRTHCTDGERQRQALEASREGRELIRQHHDRGVVDAYEVDGE
ncbi:MAG: ferritin-like domain-containing protein [Haloferacaceae archaeon]